MSEGSAPHSNQAVVADPFGFTPPFSVAPLVVIPVAAEVETMGGVDEVVVKLTIDPFDVPAELEAATRK